MTLYFVSINHFRVSFVAASAAVIRRVPSRCAFHVHMTHGYHSYEFLVMSMVVTFYFVKTIHLLYMVINTVNRHDSQLDMLRLWKYILLEKNGENGVTDCFVGYIPIALCKSCFRLSQLRTPFKSRSYTELPI